MRVSARVALGVIAVALSSSAIPQTARDAPLLPEHILVAGDLRPHQSLDGDWHWSIDPYRDGLAGFHGEAPGKGSRRYATVDVATAMAADPTALYEQDMAHSPTVRLPQSWLTFEPEMRHYQGLVWFQRTFAAQPRPGQRTFLRFGAVDFHAYVWVNGQKAGEHVGGFTTFALDVSKLLKPGENQVTVGVDSERTAADVPPPVTDWENYGGITRSVSLVGVPETYIDDAWLRLTRDGRQLKADVRLDGPQAARARVDVEVVGTGLHLDGTTDASGRLHGAVAATGLERWSPEHPRLYQVRVRALGDTLVDRVGFRTLEVRGTDILLNGKPIFLRGIAMHEEELGANPTRHMTAEAARALLSVVKDDLHGNFVRLAHYPHADVTTRMADELGLIVWSEIPTYWRVDWANPLTLETARRMLAEEITRDRNRASIAFWSIANETPVSDARNAFLRRLVGDVRALDDSRLVTAALLAKREGAGAHVVQRIDDPLAPALDVMAINEYDGWYTDDRLADVPGITWQSDYQKPLIFSELGADALAGYHDKATSPHKFSEEYQAAFYRANLAMLDKVPFMRGMSPWILKDFRSPRRQHPVFQQGWNRKGLISETGRRKLAFDVLARWYAAKE
jgi:beta-glucuronidase